MSEDNSMFPGEIPLSKGEELIYRMYSRAKHEKLLLEAAMNPKYPREILVNSIHTAAAQTTEIMLILCDILNTPIENVLSKVEMLRLTSEHKKNYWT